MITSDPKQMTFLIVDDMDNMRRSIRAMLKLIQYGKKYYEAANGKNAWEILNSGVAKFDFVISDWHMPKMNGTELLSMMRASKKLRDTPFLMITAEANQSVVAEAAEQDVDAYLTKPFVTATLEQKINELLHYANHPSKLSLLLKKSMAWQEKGELDKAIECTKEAVEINKRSSRPLRELGRLFLKKGSLKNSLTCFKKAIQVNRLDVPSYHYLGQIYFKQGNADKAVSHFLKALELSPRHAERAFKVATLMLEMNRKKEAEKVFKIMLRYNPGNIDLYEDVAESCLENGLYNLAEKSFTAALTTDPSREYLKRKLAASLLKGGHPKEAIVILEEVVKRSSEDIEVLLHLAQSYLDINVKMRADKWASRVVRIDPKNKTAQKILDQCL